MIRTSLSPNVLKAGFRANVIPSEAEALIDIRALPDEDLPKFVERLREVIGNPHIEIKTNSGRPAAPASSLNTEMFAALEAAQKRIYPGSVTIPVLLTGATDLSPLRAKGIQAYGIGPVADSEENGGAHSDDERILEKSLHGFVRFFWHAVLEVAGKVTSTPSQQKSLFDSADFLPLPRISILPLMGCKFVSERMYPLGIRHFHDWEKVGEKREKFFHLSSTPIRQKLEKRTVFGSTCKGMLLALLFMPFF